MMKGESVTDENMKIQVISYNCNLGRTNRAQLQVDGSHAGLWAGC
jgi:hypothetical protein